MQVSRYQVPFPTRGSVLGEEEVAALSALVGSGRGLSGLDARERFEQRFARHVGAAHALSTTSGTVAIELAIHLADLRPGDEVVVTPQTYQATIQPLLDRDVVVRFCDVEPDTLNLDPTVLATLVNDRTAAVVLVHYGGLPADMARITELAHGHGAIVIEDCAHALGARRDGRRPGAMADIGCFSFHNSKNLTTLGEGGMITVGRDDWALRLDRIRSNKVDAVLGPGADTPAHPLLPWMMFAEEIYGVGPVDVRRAGTNATLSEAAAAVGLVQLDRLPALAARRRDIASRLDAVVRGHAGFRVQNAPDGVDHAYHLYTFFVDHGAAVRERIVHALDEAGVEVQLRYFPLHLTPEWRSRGHGPGECPVAEHDWFTSHINLPCHPSLSDEQVDYLADALNRCLADAADAALSVSHS